MTKRPQTLGIELRFWPDDRVEAWHAVFDALWSWDAALRPQVFQVTIGEGMRQPGERPWDDARSADLARLLAGQSEFLWMLGGEPGHHMSTEGHDGRISMGIQIPAPRQPVADYYLDLLRRLPERQLPVMGMLFHYEDLDASFDRQGLRRLTDVPPILHLDARALSGVGGRERLRAAPCEVKDAPGGGLVFVVRAYPLARPTRDESERTRGVAEFLGISEGTPLVIAPPDRPAGQPSPSGGAHR